MQIITDINSLPSEFQNSVLMIGNFDSVHRGHQHLINEAKNIASRLNKKVALLTFNPHPASILQPNLDLINIFPYEEKVNLLQKAGIEILYIHRFNLDFAKTKPEDFIKKVLVNKLKISSLVVGEDFRFGSSRTGSIKLLKELSKDYNFNVHCIELKSFGSDIFSSTKVRNYLAEGEIKTASMILGYDYYIRNTVIYGQQNGKKIGFPTANLSIDGLFSPKHGVYAAYAIIEGDQEKYKAVANLGTRPTIDTQKLLEAHLLEFDKDIYGKKLTIYLNKYIRPQIKFNNLDELKRQISLDVQKAKNILAK